jgi:hypothetical protein
MLPSPGPQCCNQDTINQSKQVSDPLGGLQKETASHQQKLCMFELDLAINKSYLTRDTQNNTSYKQNQ